MEGSLRGPGARPTMPRGWKPAGFDTMLPSPGRKARMAVPRKTNRVKPAEPRISAEALKRWYTDMLLIRRFEERAGQMYGMGLIGGVCHLYIWQEAVGVGMQGALPGADTRVPPHLRLCTMLRPR